MSGLPKLKIKLPFAREEAAVCDLEQAEHYLNWGNETYLIAIDGQVINSYEELIQLATRDCYKDREFLEVWLLPLIEGG
mgnify:CR=1 FL=1